jgi:hypothetical protein
MRALLVALMTAVPGDPTAPEPELWPVQIGTKVGFIDAGGSMVLQPQWSNGRPFAQGLGAVSSHQAWFFIDRAGKTVIPGPFTEVRSFSEGYAAVRNERSQWFFVDQQGRPQCSPEFQDLFDVKDGIAVAKRQMAPKNPEPEYIWVTPKGQLALPVKVPGCWGFVAPFRYREHLRTAKAPALLVRCGRDDESFSVRAGDQPNHWGYLSRDGSRWIVAPTLDISMPFSDGRAAVHDARGWSFIDATGATVIPPGFGHVVLPFVRGLALVSRGKGAAESAFAIGLDGKDRFRLPKYVEGPESFPLWNGVLRFGDGFLLTVADPAVLEPKSLMLAGVLIGGDGRERARFGGMVVLGAQGALAELMPLDLSLRKDELPPFIRLYINTAGKVIYRLRP